VRVPIHAYIKAAAPASIAASVVLIYWAALHAPFVEQDLSSIVGNVSLRHGFWSAMADSWTGGRLVMGRPVLNLSFALNYRLGGLRPAGYHATNVLIHLGSALSLFGIIRRAFKGDVLLAWGVALLWAVHPLQTDAVSYTAQRAESLAGFFALFSLYGFIRAVPGREEPSSPGMLWFAASATSCWLGMGTNEVMVSIPFILMLYDRTFYCASWKEVVRRRWLWHLIYLASIVWLYSLAAASHNRGGSYGWTAVPWLRYALAQYAAFGHYLLLTVWPHPLAIDYGSHYGSSIWQIAPGAALFAFCAFVAMTTFRRPTLTSFLAVAFLELLEPTSIMPYRYELAADHRMYLALAPLLLGLVCGLRAWLNRARGPERSGGLFAGLVAAAAIALGTVTFERNQDYRTHSHLNQE
jgi:hypothetical protein